MNLRQWFFRLLRWERDFKAIERGRVPERIWNRGVSTLLRKVARKTISVKPEDGRNLIAGAVVHHLDGNRPASRDAGQGRHLFIGGRTMLNGSFARSETFHTIPQARHRYVPASVTALKPVSRILIDAHEGQGGATKGAVSR
jgi:hypothetical protein